MRPRTWNDNVSELNTAIDSIQYKSSSTTNENVSVLSLEMIYKFVSNSSKTENREVKVSYISTKCLTPTSKLQNIIQVWLFTN